MKEGKGWLAAPVSSSFSQRTDWFTAAVNHWVHMGLTKIEPQHFYSLLPLVVIVWLLWCNDVNVDGGGVQSGLPAPTLCFCFLWSEEIQQEDPHRRSAQPQEDVWKTQTRTSTETITDWLSRCLHLRYGTTNSTFPSTDHGNAHFSETE